MSIVVSSTVSPPSGRLAAFAARWALTAVAADARAGSFGEELIEALELTLLVGGVAMAATGAGIRNQTLSGVGLGLALESGGLLIFDLYAGRRALRWTHSLEHFSQPR